MHFEYKIKNIWFCDTCAIHFGFSNIKYNKTKQNKKAKDLQSNA